MANKTLYVGNLPYSVTESKLTEHFSAYGATNSRIVEGRGFGFVEIDGDKLESAVAEKHDTDMDGRTIVVNEARPKGEGGGGNRGGNSDRSYSRR